MRELVHTATLKVRGVEIRMATDYSVDIDLLQPADGFRLTVPLDARTVALIPLDAEFDFAIDDQPIVTGFVDKLDETASNQLVVSGRCRTGRLVDEGAALRENSQRGLALPPAAQIDDQASRPRLTEAKIASNISGVSTRVFVL